MIIQCYLSQPCHKKLEIVALIMIYKVIFQATSNIIENTVIAQKLHLLCNNFNFFDFWMLKYIEWKIPGAFLKHQLFVYLHLWPLDGFFKYLQK